MVLTAREASSCAILPVPHRTPAVRSRTKACWKSPSTPWWTPPVVSSLAPRAPMAELSRVARRIRVPLGFAFAVLYFWLARPSWRSLAFGAVLIIPGLVIRAQASGHVRKNEALAMSGPYAHTRNPLYLGSLLMGIGFALAARSWWAGTALIAMFFVIYVPVIRREEAFLPARFPELA